jgi:alpha-D-xyloside xylohydrolase
MRKGVTAHYARGVFDARVQREGVTVVANCNPVRNRGDMLEGPALTVSLSSPAPDVIRVRATHFAGVQDHGPHFEVLEKPGPVETKVSDEAVTFIAGRLSAHIPRDSWQIDFIGDGKPLTQSPARGLAYMVDQTAGPFMLDQLTLAPGELIYGLGERFTAFVKNGQVVDIWNEDGGANSEQAYKNVPFFMTNRGYGVFVNNSGKVSFEIASERCHRTQFSVPGETLDYFVIYGPTPKEVLEKYTALLGRPALPPPWSFGLWLSTSFTTNYDEATVNEFIKGMKDREIPLSVFHYDCFWMRAFHWCDFEWDPAVFPDPKGMLKRLHEQQGLKVCVWMNPYIGQESKLFEEGKAGGFLLKRPNGDVWQWDKWQPGLALVDFTNPAARKWFQDKLSALIDMGVDALKTDFGERIPTDVAYFDGSDPVRMHNYYTQIYNQTVFEVLEAKKGKGEVVLFARSATAGGQKYPVHWGGDCWSDFMAMAESLRAGLSLGMSGFGYWSHDIGGFEGKPPVELYKRWVAFGLLSSHSRLHGSQSYRVPWIYDDDAVDVLRLFVKLKCSLMPYLWAKAMEAHETGVPMMRAMHLEFPDDPACDTLDRQYMLGDSLLVAPVFTQDGSVSYYVPEGRWTKLLTGEEVQGPRWIKEIHDAHSIPLLVRPNTILATGRDDRPDYDYTKDVSLKAYGMGEGAISTTVLRDENGGRFVIKGSISGGKLHTVAPPGVTIRS